MKQGWRSKKLGDVCEVIAGQSPKGEYYNSDGVGLPFYQGKKEFTGKYIGLPKKWTSVTTKEALKDDVLMSVRAPVGPVNFSTQRICIGRGLAAIRTGSLINKEFLYNFLVNHENQIVGNTGAVFNSINQTQIKSIPIPVPPLEEQKQIVAKLDQCFEAIDKAKANAAKNLENAKELFQSKLNEIFSQKGEGWVEVVLNEIGETQTGTTPPTKDISNYGDYIPFVKPPHFSPDGSINTGSSMLSKSGLEKGRLFQSNSVLMVCIGATIGKTGFSTVPVSSNQQINCLTPKKEYNPKLFYYGLISPFVQRQVIEIGSGSQATLPIINKSKWSKLRINIPTERSVQDVIVQLLDGLKQKTQPLESKYQQELNSLEELKKSILQKAFKGEL